MISIPMLGFIRETPQSGVFIRLPIRLRLIVRGTMRRIKRHVQIKRRIPFLRQKLLRKVADRVFFKPRCRRPLRKRPLRLLVLAHIPLAHHPTSVARLRQQLRIRQMPSSHRFPFGPNEASRRSQSYTPCVDGVPVAQAPWSSLMTTIIFGRRGDGAAREARNKRQVLKKREGVNRCPVYPFGASIRIELMFRIEKSPSNRGYSHQSSATSLWENKGSWQRSKGPC